MHRREGIRSVQPGLVESTRQIFRYSPLDLGTNTSTPRSLFQLLVGTERGVLFNEAPSIRLNSPAHHPSHQHSKTRQSWKQRVIIVAALGRGVRGVTHRYESPVVMEIMVCYTTVHDLTPCQQRKALSLLWCGFVSCGRGQVSRAERFLKPSQE